MQHSFCKSLVRAHPHRAQQGQAWRTPAARVEEAVIEAYLEMPFVAKKQTTMTHQDQFPAGSLPSSMSNARYTASGPNGQQRYQ